MKIWVRFTYPNDLLPETREQAELFHAHAYPKAKHKTSNETEHVKELDKLVD